MTIEITWWMIPTIITVAAILGAFFWPAERGGYLGGLAALLMLVPALSIIAIAWIIAGVLK